MSVLFVTKVPMNILTAGAVIINQDHKILLVLRPADKKIFPNCRALPGGKVEAGESLDSAVVREVKEETGLEIISLEKYTFTEYISTDNHNISHLFYWSYKWSLKPETQATWYSYDELSGLPLSFNQNVIFEDLHNKWVLA